MDQQERLILEEYEARPGVITPAFVAALPWEKIQEHPLPANLVPVLKYMAEIERLTERFADDLRRTSTWRNPMIRRFVERWTPEEVRHGELLMRFMGEAGFPHEPDWYAHTQAGLTRTYQISSRITTPVLSRVMGDSFEAVHMVWGSITEYTGLSAYARLGALAKHPVLDTLLEAIMAEEARHARFYWKMAELKLSRSDFTRILTRAVVDHVWKPVGEGPHPKYRSDEIIRKLFDGQEGVDRFDAKISTRLRRLPGFADCTRVTERIAETALAG